MAVAAGTPEKLLGVRDGFLRYFHDGLERPVAVRVTPQEISPGADLADLPLSDEETIVSARSRAEALQEAFGPAYPFYVGCEGGLHSMEVDGAVRHFVRAWTVILGVAGEACGASGSLQIPPRLIDGLDRGEISLAVPGTRRAGGMIGSLTGRLETQRTAMASATFHALSTLFYGILESRPIRTGERGGAWRHGV